MAKNKKNNYKSNQNTKKIPIKVNNEDDFDRQKTGINSRVIRNELLYNEKIHEITEKTIEEDLTITKQQKFNFDNIETEDELDTSFVEKKRKKTKIEKVPPVIVEKYKYPKVFITVLLMVIVGFIGFISYHYVTFNHNKTKTEVKKVQAMDDNFVFVGDSITDFYDLKKYYKDMPVVNSGSDGNSTTDILNNMEDRIYKYNPTKVLLLIGTNDIPRNMKKGDIVNDIKNIIQGIKDNKPHCEIYLESIYPINNTDDDKIDSNMVKNRKNVFIKEINADLKKYASNTSNVKYIDVFDKLIDKDGNLDINYTKEGLHLNDEGYEVVTKELKKYLAK